MNQFAKNSDKEEFHLTHEDQIKSEIDSNCAVAAAAEPGSEATTIGSRYSSISFAALLKLFQLAGKLVEYMCLC